jgi:Amt family ammonium transporter
MSDAAPSAPEFKAGDIAWTLTSTALVWLMIPGLGYFYSGMARSKNALSLIMLSVISIAVVSFQVRKKKFQLHCRGIGLG